MERGVGEGPHEPARAVRAYPAWSASRVRRLPQWLRPERFQFPLDALQILARAQPPEDGQRLRLPLLSRLVPAAQAIRWGQTAVYRDQLRWQTQAYCGVSVCYEAVLLDAAPGAV